MDIFRFSCRYDGPEKSALSKHSGSFRHLWGTICVVGAASGKVEIQRRSDKSGEGAKILARVAVWLEAGESGG
jgi:hypothetical protein